MLDLTDLSDVALDKYLNLPTCMSHMENKCSGNTYVTRL